MRWQAFDYTELIKRDKINLDLFWLKDESLEDSADLPAPDVIVEEIADDLATALEKFPSITAAPRSQHDRFFGGEIGRRWPISSKSKPTRSRMDLSSVEANHAPQIVCARNNCIKVFAALSSENARNTLIAFLIPEPESTIRTRRMRRT